MYRAMCIEGHTGHTDTQITQTRTSQAIPHNHPTHKRTHAQTPDNFLVGISGYPFLSSCDVNELINQDQMRVRWKS